MKENFGYSLSIKKFHLGFSWREIIVELLKTELIRVFCLQDEQSIIICACLC